MYEYNRIAERVHDFLDQVTGYSPELRDEMLALRSELFRLGFHNPFRNLGFFLKAEMELEERLESKPAVQRLFEELLWRRLTWMRLKTALAAQDLARLWRKAGIEAENYLPFNGYWARELLASEGALLHYRRLLKLVHSCYIERLTEQGLKRYYFSSCPYVRRASLTAFAKFAEGFGEGYEGVERGFIKAVEFALEGKRVFPKQQKQVLEEILRRWRA